MSTPTVCIEQQTNKPQTSELTSLQRQLMHAQQQVADKRRKSNASPSRELQAQLASKTSTIESLELELSNLRNQYNMSQTAASAHEATIQELQQRVTTAEQATDAANKEIDSLKETINKPVDSTQDAATLQATITTLESNLRTAQASVDTATSRATSLEQKIETLTKVHKDQSTTHDTQIKDLTSKLAALQTTKYTSTTANDTDSNTESELLHQRIRDLEAENTDLRRGVWRDQRAALQPDINDDTSPASYEDVDLNNPYTASSSTSRPRARTGSSFQDVLQSGINAFTGGSRKQSLGLLSEGDDFEFDEDSFRLAQEEEGRKRIERIREIKRGLEEWRGWRVDLVDARAGGLGGGAQTGPLFEV
jgi:predicted  nucleic acid-binding Zn-ribbon protein